MLEHSPLGKSTPYQNTYNPHLLFALPRTLGREKIQLNSSLSLPFQGVDIWNGYEISWLNPKGKPQIALGQFSFPCNSKFLIESKSFKLYLNSLNQSTFESIEVVQNRLEKDLSEVVKAKADVKLQFLSEFKQPIIQHFEGQCLDHLDILVDTYFVHSPFLKTLLSPKETEEKLYSHLLKSNCLATGQPDWGSIFIHYQGPKIDHEGLLKYLISYRNHLGFHEHCVEQIFCAILDNCRPKKLTVYARYTRRGGLDINPFRSNFDSFPKNLRLIRQ